MVAVADRCAAFVAFVEARDVLLAVSGGGGWLAIDYRPGECATVYCDCAFSHAIVLRADREKRLDQNVVLIDLNYSVLGTVILPMFYSILWRYTGILLSIFLGGGVSRLVFYSMNMAI